MPLIVIFIKLKLIFPIKYRYIHPYIFSIFLIIIRSFELDLLCESIFSEALVKNVLKKRSVVSSISNWYVVSNLAVHLMQCLNYSKSW